jgi:uncharacterized protein (TIGR00730 family)
MVKKYPRRCLSHPLSTITPVRTFRRLCVYCGSNRGTSPAFTEAATLLGRTLAARGIGIVYGGGHVGLMGVLADAALAEGGEVIGVIPTSLQEKELGHSGLTEMHVVGSMHERKQMMADLSDGFIAMPGGIGTLEELFETFTWLQLGFHDKPVALLNVGGFYDKLIEFVHQLTRDGFLKREHEGCLLADTDPAALLEKMRCFELPDVGKWMERLKAEER